MSPTPPAGGFFSSGISETRASVASIRVAMEQAFLQTERAALAAALNSA
jgi:hypothetical protein